MCTIGGVSDCKQHARDKAYMKLIRERSKGGIQTQLFSGVTGAPAWTDADKVARAEILQALHTVDKNISFASASGDTLRFMAMFPDSQIASKYQMGETKMKYLLQFGIAPYMKSSIMKDIASAPFSFKFDETTTSQVKKTV